MKIKAFVFGLFITLLIPFGTTYAAASSPSINVNDQTINFNVPPKIENGVTLVQFRPIFESLGLEIGWNQKSKVITGTKEGLEIKLTIGSKKAIVNGMTVNLDVAPKSVNGNTLVPLRFVGEAAGSDVRWDKNSNVITINSNGNIDVGVVDQKPEGPKIEKDIPELKSNAEIEYKDREKTKVTIEADSDVYPAGYFKIKTDGPAYVYVMKSAFKGGNKNDFDNGVKNGNGYKFTFTSAKEVNVSAKLFEPERYWVIAITNAITPFDVSFKVWSEEETLKMIEVEANQKMTSYEITDEEMYNKVVEEIEQWKQDMIKERIGE